MLLESEIWIDFKHGRYFLIPQKVSIQAGDLTIYQIDGTQKKVNEIELQKFETNEQIAREYLVNQITQSQGITQNILDNLLQSLSSLSENGETIDQNLLKSQNKNQEIAKLIDSMLNPASNQSYSNLATIIPNVHQLLIETIELLRNPHEQQETKQKHLNNLQKNLQDQGINYDSNTLIEQLRELIQCLMSNDDFVKYLQEESNKQNQLKTGLNNSEYYQEIARESIEKARQSRQMSSFSFDDLLNK